MRISPLKRSGMDHIVFTLQTNHTCLHLVSVHQTAPPLTSNSSHLIATYYSLLIYLQVTTSSLNMLCYTLICRLCCFELLVTSLDCHKICKGQCFGAGAGECCNYECTGGCSGPSNTECWVVSFSHEISSNNSFRLEWLVGRLVSLLRGFIIFNYE